MLPTITDQMIDLPPGTLMQSHQALLRLLQLTSPALPVGAYSYSEGLETLVQQGTIANSVTLEQWLSQELQFGAIRLEAATIPRVYTTIQTNQLDQLAYWNHWISALRETEELRQQSWQMGRSLTRLLRDLQPDISELIASCGEPCNFSTAFALAAAYWHIELRSAVLGYLHSWAANLINAGVRLVPLGQTQGQQVLLNLDRQLNQTTDEILQLGDNELWSCNWGLTIASMNHETLYSRLFRS